MSQEINMQWIKAACAHYEIGEPLGELKPVTGGLLHRMWELRTTTGHFALKLLNPEIMSRAGVMANYMLSERIAAAAAMAGIPVVLARRVKDHPLNQVLGTTVMLFDWIDGSVLTPGDCRTEHASMIGTLLHNIHHMNFQEHPKRVWKSFGAEHWKSLAEDGIHTGKSWAQQIESGLPELLEWNERFVSASSVLNQRLAAGHCDLNPKNVIWKEPCIPYIIDWEAAGPTNPTMELLDAALSWSGLDAGQVKKELFMAMIDSYRKAGGKALTDVEEALCGRIGGMLEWLEYNMRRSLRSDIFGESEQRLGSEQVQLTFLSLKELTANIEVWTEWVKEGN